MDRRELQIATRSLGDTVELTVADTGPGIAPELAERLFQPFATTKKSGPSGGTVFRVALPIAREEDGDNAG